MCENYWLFSSDWADSSSHEHENMQRGEGSIGLTQSDVIGTLIGAKT